MSGGVLGVLAAGVLALLVGASCALPGWTRQPPVVHGLPVVVLRAGVPVWGALRAEGLSLDDLGTAAAAVGIERLDEIELALLELSGRVAFFARCSTRARTEPTYRSVAPESRLRG